MKGCGFVIPRERLSEHDRVELDKFTELLKLEQARKAGADPNALGLLEQALYPEGIGRPPVGGTAEG